MADDAPTAPGAAGVRHTAASRHDSSSEAFRVGVQPEGLTMARFSRVVTRSTTTSH